MSKMTRVRIPARVGWNDYWTAVQRCDRWWKDCPSADFSVLEAARSWRGVIRKLGALVREDWSAFDSCDQKRLLGLQRRGAEDWALLGRMWGRALPAVFGNDSDRERIEKAVKQVICAREDDFPRVALDACQQIQSFPQVGPGVATRLLSVARPDRVVSLNGGSVKGLASYAGLAHTTLAEQPRRYEELLRCIYREPWFRTAIPQCRSRLEQEVWSMRVALLDCFVYRV